VKLAVVGAGIHGLCVARHAVQRGWDVHVYDQGCIPNPLSSSFDEHRLIRYPYGHDDGYTALVATAYEAWERMWPLLGDRYHIETGTLAISRRTTGFIEASVKAMQRLGIAVDIIDTEQAKALVPHVRVHDDEEVLWSPTGDALLAHRILVALVRTCREHGVHLHERHKVREGHEFAYADCTFWARGAWASGVLPSRQSIAYFRPPATWKTCRHPMVLDLAGDDGFYLVPGVAKSGWKLGVHRSSGAGHPDDIRSLTSDELKRLGTLARTRLQGLSSDMRLTGLACYYALVDKGRFQLHGSPRIMEFRGGSGHSFKFGALVGETVCQVAAGETDFGDAQKLLAGQVVI